MSVWRSNKTAVCVTAVAVVASTLLGSHRSLAATRRGVEKTITQGADGSGYSIATDSQNMVNIARNLMTVAKRYLPADHALFADLEEYCQSLEGAKTAADWKNGQDGVQSVCQSIQMELAKTPEVTEGDRAYLAGFQVDLEAAVHSVAMDPYNDLARDFNQNVLGKFPANFLGKLTFISPLETFD